MHRLGDLPTLQIYKYCMSRVVCLYLEVVIYSLFSIIVENNFSIVIFSLAEYREVK